MIAIVDYGLGNLRSVQKAFEFVGYDCTIMNSVSDLKNANGIVLPGVGAFKLAMKNLEKSDLKSFIKDWILKDKPFLGICLGLQLLFDYSEEGNDEVEGLKVIKGSVRKFPNDSKLKVPQIGWNSVEIKRDVPIFKGIENGSYFYFVHSFYARAKDEKNVISKTNYSIEYDSAVGMGNVYATQFHPEKSGKTGLKVIENFAKIVYSE